MVVFWLIAFDFATSSLALHKHVVYIVVKTLSTSARIALKTLAPMFSGERSEAYSHRDTSKWCSFFPVREIPLHLICLNLIFSAVNGQLHPIFVQILRRVHDQNPKFRPLKNFCGELVAKNFNFHISQRAKIILLILSLQKSWKCECFRTRGWNTIQLTGLQWYLLRNFFRSVLVKKVLKFLSFLSRLDMPHCPLRFLTLTLNFYKHVSMISLLTA